ncbi:DUF6174 domain-containing protein [Okeanomitos corallinicola TIOX110]|uniref:DUF6174 domain-containing protein n=1 Tax=Okeanomitos corallinicola TIOX110 TaxID=3133117 RepID=A0ABZ2UV50_9CYAN
MRRLFLTVGTGLIIALGMQSQLIAKPPTPASQVKSNQSNLKILKKNTVLWKKANIANYRYQLTRSCFCIPSARQPVLIEVRNGKTVSVTSVETGQPVDRELFNQYDRVPKLFSLIRDGIARKADSLNVNYEPKAGYPTQISIDYSQQQADEELYLNVDKFEVLD